MTFNEIKEEICQLGSFVDDDTEEKAAYFNSLMAIADDEEKLMLILFTYSCMKICIKLVSTMPKDELKQYLGKDAQPSYAYQYIKDALK